jgi:glycosyltransferase involved in cell wall biosynthesis
MGKKMKKKKQKPEPKKDPLVSICIPCHNQAHFVGDAILTSLIQSYENIEVIVLDDASMDKMNEKDTPLLSDDKVKLFRSDEPSGTGGAFNKAIDKATGDYIICLCSDDKFTSETVVEKIVGIFENNPRVAHVSRHYYQFIDGEEYAVRAWRQNDIMELANNPSGLAFRKSAIGNARFSNLMFVEAANMVYEIMQNQHNLAMIIPNDTVAIRIHESTARSKDYYRKRWTSSPIEEWVKRNGKALLKDYTSLIQIKNYFETKAVFIEAWNFIKYRPVNALMPHFWAIFLGTVITPRFLLLRVPHWYRKTIGRWINFKKEK